VIEIGDLIALVGNYAKNLSSRYVQASYAEAADNFLGVAMQASASGETTPIRVATSGTFEYPCDSASVYLGYFAEVDDSASSIEDQSVNIATSVSNKAIGTVMPNNVGGVGHGAGSQTTCLVRIWCNALQSKIDS
jgi:hypothetical protein